MTKLFASVPVSAKIAGEIPPAYVLPDVRRAMEKKVRDLGLVVGEISLERTEDAADTYPDMGWLPGEVVAYTFSADFPDYVPDVA